MRTIAVVLAVVMFAGCVADVDGYQLVSDEPAEEPADSAVPLEIEEVDPLDEPEETTIIYAAVAMLDAEEVAFLAKLNAYRASLGKPAMRASIALTRAANAHSQDMATNDHFAHNSSDGTSFSTRVKRYYDYNTGIGENIAAGYQTGDAVFGGWKNSPGHDAIMRGDYSVVGISRIVAANGTPYWTADFGGFRDAIFSAGVSTILSNAGFESTAITTGVDSGAVRTLQRWHTFASGGGTVTRRSDCGEAGVAGLRTVDVSAGKTAATQIVRAAAGIRYQVTARTRHVSGPSSQTVYLDFLRSDYTRISVVTMPTGTTTTWSTTTAMADAPSGTRYVKIILYGPAATGVASTHDWDTIKLTAQ